MSVQYLSVYWGGSMIGRFIGARVLLFISAARLLSIYAVINMCLLVCVASLSGVLAMWSILLIGLFNSIMFPVIFATGLNCFQLVKQKNMASAYLTMATVGGAIIPVLQGLLADKVGLQLSFITLIFCYAYIAFFGRLAGHD